MTVGQMRTNAAEVLKDGYLLEPAEGERRMGFRRYEGYRDSGVEWIGEVPDSWTIGHLRWFISIASGDGLSNSQFSKVPSEEDCYRVIGGNGTLGYSKYVNTVQKAFAVGRVGALCGNIHFLKEDCWINDNSLKISKWNGFNDLYLGYLLSAANLNQYASQSAQPLITSEDVKSLKVPIPPSGEQAKIASFLDRETGKIDSLVDKQEQLIELLQEKRQEIVSHAVTKGLNPNAKMKDSGVEWLGEVPEGWAIKSLKYAFRRIVGGSTPSSAKPIFWDGDIVWITPADVSKTTRLKNSRRRITQEGLLSCSTELVPSGSIIVTSRAPVGNVALAETELCTNQGCKALIVPSSTINPIFAFHLLSILKPELQRLATGTTFTEIATSKLGAIQLPIPPLREQIAIIAYLNRETAKIDSLIERCETAIELFKERRTALISDAVTGKIDVRSAV